MELHGTQICHLHPFPQSSSPSPPGTTKICYRCQSTFSAYVLLKFPEYQSWGIIKHCHGNGTQKKSLTDSFCHWSKSSIVVKCNFISVFFIPCESPTFVSIPEDSRRIYGVSFVPILCRNICRVPWQQSPSSNLLLLLCLEWQRDICNSLNFLNSVELLIVFSYI